MRGIGRLAFCGFYGVSTRDDVRRSKLVFYTGRGSLEGWLRTVMAQEFINRYRKQKRTVSLEEQTEEGVQFARRSRSGDTPGRESTERLEAPPTRHSRTFGRGPFTVGVYYLDERTLARFHAL